MIVKFFSTSKQDLSNVPVTPGQIVCTSDSNGMYYDVNGVRYKQQPADDVLYRLVPASSVNASGVTGVVDYTKDSGTLGQNLSLTATEYKSLEFVFYDNGFGTQFSSVLYGMEYGNGLYTYNWCNKTIASYDTDSTQILGSNNIYRETVYATVTVTADGTFNVTSKTNITETVSDGVITMSEKDISGDNRLALILVIGRR